MQLKFLWDFQDWEIEGVIESMDLLYSKKILKENEDCLFWTQDEKGRV